MPDIKSVAARDAVEVPLYTALDAARYLRVPVWVVLSTSGRPPHHPMELFQWFWHGPFRARIVDDCGPIFPEGGDERFSFRTLATLFVSSSVFQPLLPELPHPTGYPEGVFRFFEQAHQAVRRLGDDPKVFADPNWMLSRFDRISDLLPDAHRVLLLKLITLYQARVELKDGVPVRLFPFSRDPAPAAPRTVVIDPELRFGRPTVKGAPTDVLAERWRAGDNPAELGEDYGLTTDEVDEALRYEAIPYHPMTFFPFPPFGW